MHTVHRDLGIVRHSAEGSEELLDAIERLDNAGMGDVSDVIADERTILNNTGSFKPLGFRKWTGPIDWCQRGSCRTRDVHFRRGRNALERANAEEAENGEGPGEQ